jgi:hypothetical protein
MKELNWIKHMLKVIINICNRRKKSEIYKDIKVDHGQEKRVKDAVRKRYRGGKKKGKRR